MPINFHGQRVLLTGASSGIGAEYARALAKRGADLVLVARRSERLQQLAGELTAGHGVAVATITLDLAEPHPGRRLHDELAARELSVISLINCAGVGSFGLFHDDDPDWLDTEIAVDVSAVVDISRAFIDQLRGAGVGVLINVASMAGYTPTPRMAVYGATKAFVLSFTEALARENADGGLRVLSVSPGATRTEFFDVVGTQDAAGGTKLVEPREVVDATFSALDRRRVPSSVIVGRANRATALASRLLGPRATARAVWRVTRPTVPDA